jgi:hypothetical protein
VWFVGEKILRKGKTRIVRNPDMVHAAVCLERKYLIADATIDKVIDACHKALKEMGLKITEEKSAKEGKTTVLAKEGAMIPLVVKTLLFPFSISDYVKSAQRSGVHVVISQSKDGILLYSCGMALDETTGKLAEYTKEDLVEEVTNTMEALDFENKFINRIRVAFPKAKEIE